MPSSYTASLRLELQAAGENLNTWGAPKLNNVISRIDSAIAGWTDIALTDDIVLTSSNGSADQSRQMMLNFTGAGGFTVTTPAAPKIYVVRNGTTGDTTITTGSGVSAVVESGEISVLICDGTNWRPLGVAGLSIKAYVDQQAFAALDGDLPGQPGNAGKVLSTDGETASWQSVTTRPDFIQASAAADKRAVGFAYFPRG